MRGSAVVWIGALGAVFASAGGERAALADVVAPPDDGKCPPGTEALPPTGWIRPSARS